MYNYWGGVGEYYRACSLTSADTGKGTSQESNPSVVGIDCTPGEKKLFVTVLVTTGSPNNTLLHTIDSTGLCYHVTSLVVVGVVKGAHDEHQTLLTENRTSDSDHVTLNTLVVVLMLKQSG